MHKQKFNSILALCATLLILSCSNDDDNGQQPTPAPQQYDLMATLPAQPVSAWSNGDEVRLMSVETIKQGHYQLVAGEGSSTGSFNLVTGSANVVQNDVLLYAYTYNKNIEGIWATSDNYLEIGQKISGLYQSAELGSANGVVPRPVAIWGFAKLDTDDKMQTQLHQLTGFMAITPSQLPADTKALVLSCHHDYTLNGQKVSGGNDEPLSGLFTAVLKDGAYLVDDDDFICHDTLRVNMDKGTYDRLYIPLVAGNYSRLSVIAVTADSYDGYTWEGTEIKAFTNRTVAVGDVLE